jgi:predicted methyltransferase
MLSAKSPRSPFLKLTLFLICSVLIILAFNTLSSFAATLNKLDVVESERDGWQRPLDVLRALGLREGIAVADVGSGAGYFALKLSPAVGKKGRVVAVDRRKLSLFFLWARALLRGQRNVQIVVGEEDDPRLPSGILSAALICNTYHEFSHPQSMLNHVFRSLRPGGLVVIVDRSPRATQTEDTHEMALAVVRDELLRERFEIVSQDDHFIQRPADDGWWMLVGRKP